jgi:putative membrane protein
MKVQTLMISTCLLVGLALGSCDKNDDINNDSLNDTDQDFMTKTSISNTAEIGAGNIASNKATIAGVKTFGQHMIMEHTPAQNDLKTLGTNVGYAVKDTLDPEHVALAAQLNALTGRAFDSTYIVNQVTDHDKTIAIFQNELTNGRHQAVKNYANTNLPHIQMHRAMADSIAKANNFKK